MEKLWHTLEVSTVEDELDTDSTGGLKSSSADKRRRKKKSNDTLKTLRTFFNAFLMGFADVTVIILAFAAVISFFMGAGADAILILAITVLNSFIGAARAVKNSRITGYTHNLRVPYARVLRDNVVKLIPVSEVVCGDILDLKKGDILYFDCRIASASGLSLENNDGDVRDAVTEKLDEASEEPYPNMIYCGDVVVKGEGRAIVCCEHIEDEDVIISTDIKEFSLHKKLLEVSRIVTSVIAVFCTGIFTIGVLQHRDMFEMLVIAVCLAAAAVPNGLYSVVYSVLFAGAEMLSKKNVTVNSLYAADTLSCVDCICVDKDGILTDNVFKAECAVIADKSWNINEYGISDNDRSIIKMLFDFSVLCSRVADNGDVILGAPVDVAVAGYAKSNGTLKNMLDKKYQVIAEKEYEKYSVKTVKIKDGYRIIAKGEAEAVLSLCSECVLSDGISDFSEVYRNKISENKKAMSENAMRVISVAFRDVEELTGNDEKDFIFAGMIGVSDGISQETVKAVSLCERAGIKLLVTDGDCVDNVFAVAARSGIAKADGGVLTGSDVDIYDEKTLVDKLKNVFAFAGIDASQKNKVISALKADGYTVASTANLANTPDEVASADIGISVNHERCTGISNVADVVIDRGSFPSVLNAVIIGRGIQSNIKRVTNLVVTSGLSILFLMCVALMIFPEIPLLPIHILWTTFILNSIASFVLSGESADPRLMKEKPRDKNKSVFADGVWKSIIVQAVLIGVLGLFAFVCGRYFMQGDASSDAEALLTGRTMAFAVVSVAQLFNALNLKSEYTLFNAKLFGDIKILIGVISGIIIQVLIISLPVVNSVFGVCSLDFAKWMLVISLAFVTVVVSEIVKISTALLKRKKTH